MITQQASEKTVTAKSLDRSDAAVHEFKRAQSTVVAVKNSPLMKVSCSTVRADYDEADCTVTNRLLPNVDPAVFRLLPDEIQKELLSPAYLNSLPSTSVRSAELVNSPHITKNRSPQSFTDSENINDIQEAITKSESSDSENNTNHQSPAGTSALSGEGKLSLPWSYDCEFPGNVDPKVFSELPPELQRELISEWKQQKPVLKSASSRKPGRSLMTKDRKAAGKCSQANNLFKYFKPS